MLLQRRNLANITACSMMTLMLLYIVIYHRVEEIHEKGQSEIQEQPEFADYEKYQVMYDEYDDYFDSDSDETTKIEEKMEQRRDWAREACRRLGEKSSQYPNGWEYLINYEHQLIWCNVFKAASTAWLNHFLTLARLSMNDFKRDTPVSAARKVYCRPSGEELQEAHRTPGSIAFIIVRHPLERLSSAYRDKIQNTPRNTDYGKLAIHIFNTYSYRIVTVPPEEEPTKKPKFSLSVPPHLMPTFEEFVRYILTQVSRNETLDMHWIPYSQFCTPCQMEFDFILKLETFEEDQNHLIHRADIGHIIAPSILNSGQEKNVEKGRKTKELLRDHYSQLTKEQLSQLHQLYRNDFEIFNYTMDEYYDMVKEKLR